MLKHVKVEFSKRAYNIASQKIAKCRVSYSLYGDWMFASLPSPLHEVLHNHMYLMFHLIIIKPRLFLSEKKT